MATHISSLKPKLWKGFRLIGGEGTTISLPASPKIKTNFKIYELTKGGTYTVLANCAILYDVLSNLLIDTTIDLISKGEITLMNQLIDKASFSNTILLLDRGFGYFSVCNIHNRGCSPRILQPTDYLPYSLTIRRIHILSPALTRRR